MERGIEDSCLSAKRDTLLCKIGVTNGAKEITCGFIVICLWLDCEADLRVFCGIVTLQQPKRSFFLLKNAYLQADLSYFLKVAWENT